MPYRITFALKNCPILLTVITGMLISCRSVPDQKISHDTDSVIVTNAIERPVDFILTRETKALLNNLKLLQGKGIIFGQQDATITGIDWKNEENRSDVKLLTGTYPALYGYELSGISGEANIDSVPFTIIRQRMIEAFDRGGINTATWHLNNPVTGGNAWDVTPAVGQILPDSSLEEYYKIELKHLADFFNQLRNVDGKLVPVIFRPFHESNGNWFWWGKGRCNPEEYINLWRFTVSYLRDTLNVHNLLYAYSTDMFENQQQYLERYPGDDWVDILGCENYWDFQSGSSISNGIAQLRMLVEMSSQRKKLAALTECGFNGIPVKNWWTQFLLKSIREDSLACNISYMMVWRNAHLKQYYTPFPGHKSAFDFITFEQDSFTIFEHDLKQVYFLRN